MRIALFTEVFLPKIDGITNRLNHTVRCLTQQGHEVRVFAPQGSVEEHAGARVIGIPGLPFPWYPGLQIATPDPRILAELWQFAPNVVHAVGPACLGVWGIASARALGIPVVASYHTDLPRYLPDHGLDWLDPAIWPLIRAVHNRAHVNLAPSRFTAKELEGHGVEPVGVWRGGVDTDSFHPKRRSQTMRLRLSGEIPDGPILLYAGRLSPEKQLHTFATMLDRLPTARLALVGDGPAREELERTLPADRTSFLGFLRGEELATAFASADVFVMPSTTETLGFVVLEAMASGRPVVAANAGGIPDLVHDGETGWLYTPDRPEEAADRIGGLLADAAQHRYFSEQARKRALESTWDGETRKLFREYRKAIVLGSARGLAGRVLHAFAR